MLYQLVILTLEISNINIYDSITRDRQIVCTNQRLASICAFAATHNDATRAARLQFSNIDMNVCPDLISSLNTTNKLIFITENPFS